MSTKSPVLKIKKDTYESKILNFLSDFTYLTLDSFFPKNYSSYTQLGRNFFGLDNRNFDSRVERQNKRTLLNALNRLKLKGLMYKENKNQKAIWRLTENGTKMLDILANRISLPPEDGRMRLFVFDIPKAKNRHRDWLRERLIFADYKMLQKSVWLGKRPLHKDFLEEIMERDLLRNIHFFEIKNEGTLDNLDWKEIKDSKFL